MNSAAELLENRRLKSGWLVKKKIKKDKQNTGGCFSVGYEVEKEGKVAFLKALDFSEIFERHADNPAAALQEITSEFNFEKSILETCRDSRIKRVVKLLDDGVEEVENATLLPRTQYLIFEWAESSVRKEVVNSETFDHVWTLKCMHEITSGLYQLHQRQIIHQDIKPSNMLVSGMDGDIKIGDFGRAYSASHGDVEHNNGDGFPGDYTYVPPEILYRYEEGDGEVMRKKVDIYMLGGMLHFFFTEFSLTAKILAKLPPQFRPNNTKWPREQIMPYLQNPYEEVIREFEQCVQKNVREEITLILRQLTNLAPEKRGHPTAHRSHEDNLSLQRYISAFDRLSKRVSIMMNKNRMGK